MYSSTGAKFAEATSVTRQADRQIDKTPKLETSNRSSEPLGPWSYPCRYSEVDGIVVDIQPAEDSPMNVNHRHEYMFNPRTKMPASTVLILRM